MNKQIDIPDVIKPNTGFKIKKQSSREIIMIYSFTNEYRINSSPDILWDIVSDVEAWPEIWKYFRTVQFRGSDKCLKKNVTIDCEVRAIIPYTFRFNAEIMKVIPYKELEIKSRGDLKGRGLWTLNHTGSSTMSSFTWEVEPDNRFIKMIEHLPFGSSLLRYSHNIIMENGYRSLLSILEQNITSKTS